MWSRTAAAACLLLAGCRAQPSEPQFPAAHRDVAPTVSDTFSTEDARDRLGEAEQVMELAGIKPGMSVADVGAGAEVNLAQDSIGLDVGAIFPALLRHLNRCTDNRF